MKQPSIRSLNSSPIPLPYLAASALQYVVALSAVANVITVSLELGMKTVVVWEKPNSYLPLTWVLLPIVLHMGAALRLHLFIATVSSSSLHRPPSGDKFNHRVKSGYYMQQKPDHFLSSLISKIINLYHLLVNTVEAEILLCRVRTKLQLPPLSETTEVKESFLSYLLALCLPLLLPGTCCCRHHNLLLTSFHRCRRHRNHNAAIWRFGLGGTSDSKY